MLAKTKQNINGVMSKDRNQENSQINYLFLLRENIVEICFTEHCAGVGMEPVFTYFY